MATMALVATLGSGCGGGDDTAGTVSPEAKKLAEAAAILTDVHPTALGYRVVLATAGDDLRGRTDADARTVTLYLRADDPPHRVAHDLAHETAHVYDFERMNEAARVEYLRGRGAPDVPWFPPDGERSDLEVGAGDFAEVFALCHAASPEFRSRVAPRPDDACALLPQGARRSMK